MANRNAVFIDTSGWIAVLNADDALHEPACRQLADLGIERRTLITTDWILAETGNGLARTAARAGFAIAVQRFLGSPHCRLVRVNVTLFERALTLYGQMEDKSWGFVDCASFVAMQEEGIADAFASDRHFAQAGFRCLLPIG
jgi:predicted nucleic acid-binding protein